MNEKKVYQKTTTRDLMITATYPHIELYEKVRQLPSATIYYYHKLLPFLHEAFEYIKNRIKDSGDIQNQNIQFKRLKFKKKKIASNSRFFMIPPNIEILKKLLNLIDSSNATNKIIFIPRISDECNDLLNTVNSSSNNSQILVESYNFDFIPLSEKIMIIPLVDFFYETFSRQKLSLLQICSQVLLTLQLFYGKIPNVRIHGSKSKKFYDMFSEMKSKIPENNFPSSQMFSNLIIIDRMVDPLTPLLLQNSYDGLIDEIFTLKNGMIKIPFGNEEKQFSINFHGNPMKSNEMDSSFHNYIRYRLLDHDNAYLQTILKNISQSKTRTDDKESTTTVSANGKIYNIIEFDELEKSINKFLDLVNEAFTRMDKFDAYKKLREQLNYGLGLDFENFSSTIRTMLYAEENCVFASQLIMAQCVLGDKGLQQNFIDEFRDELELRYGAQIGEQLMMLEKLQLLCTKRTGKTFSQLNEHFNLCLNLDSNEQEQNDGNISSAENTADEYSGYVPLSVRIIQTDFETEKSTLKELNDYFPDQYEDGGKIQPNETTLVFFLGGITHLELAWLNWLTERHMNGMANIVVLTTDIFTSERFVKQCLPCLAKDHPSLKEMTDCALHMQSTGNFLSLNDK